MFSKSPFIRTLCAGIGFVAISALLTGCDKSYDLENLNPTFGLFENGVSAPIGETQRFYLNDFIDDSTDLLSIDEQGRYSISYSGSTSTQLELPSVEIPPLQPEKFQSQLDFYNSIPNEIRVLLEEIGGYQHGDPLPDMSGHPIDNIHASIDETVEPLTFTIDDIPQQIVNLKSITPGNEPIFKLDFHAEGFPIGLDSLRFEFIVHLPIELHLEPVDKDVWLDNDYYYHIEHKLPCVNGKLDDHIEFVLKYLEFDPPLTNNDGTIKIDSDVRFKGKIHLDHACDLSGWVPIIELNSSYEMSPATIDNIEGTIAAEIDPISITQELSDMPSLLTDPETCLDLDYITLNIGINNTTPASVASTLSIASTFYDGTVGSVEIQDPITIAANTMQNFVFSNEAQYVGQAGYIANLSDLVYKMPRAINLEARPFIPETTMKLSLNQTFNVDVDYSLNVPISAGKDFNLKLTGDMGDLGGTLKDVAEFVDYVVFKCNINSTLPIDVTLNAIPVDANGSVVKDIVIAGAPITIKSNESTPISLDIKANSDDALLKVYTLKYEIIGSANSDNSALRPDQYIQLSDITLHLPQGVEIDLNDK